MCKNVKIKHWSICVLRNSKVNTRIRAQRSEGVDTGEQKLRVRMNGVTECTTVAVLFSSS